MCRSTCGPEGSGPELRGSAPTRSPKPLTQPTCTIEEGYQDHTESGWSDTGASVVYGSDTGASVVYGSDTGAAVVYGSDTGAAV